MKRLQATHPTRGRRRQRIEILVRFSITFLTGFLLVALSAPLSSAQLTTTATISGVVTDQSGAVLPGAKLSILNTGTGVVTESTSNASGGFSVPGLPVGNYEVYINVPGFARYTETGIYLGPASVHNIDAALKPASVTQAVTVAACAYQKLD